MVIVSKTGNDLKLAESLDGARVAFTTKKHEEESFEDFDAVTMCPQPTDRGFAIDCSGLACRRFIQIHISIDSSPLLVGDLFVVLRDMKFLGQDCSMPPLMKQANSLPVSAVLLRLFDALDGTTSDLLSSVVLTERTNAAAWNRHRRVWNGLIDRFPAIIVLARSEVDVCRTVAIANEMCLELTVKGGGHNVAGSAVADGALMIDLSLLSSISLQLDQPPARVSVGGGCTWAAVDAVLHPHGLAVPAGNVT